jgi:hypothetical protein
MRSRPEGTRCQRHKVACRSLEQGGKIKTFSKSPLILPRALWTLGTGDEVESRSHLLMQTRSQIGEDLGGLARATVGPRAVSCGRLGHAGEGDLPARVWI